MSTHASLPASAGVETISQAQVQALRRVALAVARPGGPSLFADLVRELAESIQAAIVFVAVYADDSSSTMRTLAASLYGQICPISPARWMACPSPPRSDVPVST